MTSVPAKRTKSAPHRQIRSDEERAQVWVGWRLNGTRATARAHGVSSATVKRVVAQVEGMPDLYEIAARELAGAHTRNRELVDQAIAATLGRIIADVRDPARRHSLGGLARVARELRPYTDDLRGSLHGPDGTGTDTPPTTPQTTGAALLPPSLQTPRADAAPAPIEAT